MRDTGTGILAALQPELFEKFSAAARLGLGGETATDLGLFITRHIVLQHRDKTCAETRGRRSMLLRRAAEDPQPGQL